MHLSLSPLVQDISANPQEEIQGVQGASTTRRRLLLLLLTLALAAAILVRGIHKGEFSENVDETVHAATGLYVASFLHDLPLRHPVQYTYRYYAQYPSLGIVMYPPAFYVIEGVAFLLFGPSVVTARLTMIFLSLFGLYFWFRLVDELEDEYTAAFATALLAVLPSVLQYEKTVMLDIPLMAFCIAASYFWIIYLKRGTSSSLYWFAAFLSAAFLTKQHAIYLLLWCSITLVSEKKWDRVLNWRAVATASICAIFVAPFYAIQILMNASLAQNLKGTSANATMQWGYYLSELPELIGWKALILSAVGVFLYLWRGKRGNAIVMLAWIASCYIVFTSIRHKEARYIIYWVPAFAYFAVAPFTRKTSVRWMRIAGFGVVAVVVATYLVQAWNYQRPYVSGYASLAQELTEGEGGCVLIDMDLPGNFIFFMRASDPARRFVILRKALYEVRTVREWGVTEFAHDDADVQRILNEDSVRYVVVEHNMPLHFSSQIALRDLLDHSGHYKMVRTVPIETNLNGWGQRSLVLYESINPVAPPHGILRVKMANLHHDIEIPFDELTRK